MLQELAKNMMNSSYGKLALSILRELLELTTNEELIMNMIKSGAITECKEIFLEGNRFF